MADQKLELSRRKILGATGAVGAAGAAAGLGTSALFSDQEEFSNNNIQAGTLDLIVDYETSLTQDGVTTNSTPAEGTTDTGTLQGDPASGEYSINDVKPGDSGSLRFCPKVVGNPGFVFVGSDGLTGFENGQTEPEEDVDPTGGTPGEGRGELANAIQVTVAYVENDGTLIRELNNPANYTLADLFADLESGFVLDGDTDSSGTDAYPSSSGPDDQQGPCIRVEWEVPLSVGNEIQSDSVEFDVTFFAVQERNNTDFANPFVTTTVGPGSGFDFDTSAGDTLQDAIDAASAGDVISVGTGNFGGVTITTDGITLVAGSTPVLDGGEGVRETVRVEGASNVTLDGLVIMNTGGSGDSQESYGVRVVDGSDNFSIRNSITVGIFEVARATGVAIDAAPGPIPDTNVSTPINNPDVFNCGIAGISTDQEELPGDTDFSDESKAKGVGINGDVPNASVRQTQIVDIGGAGTTKARGVSVTEDSDGIGATDFLLRAIEFGAVDSLEFGIQGTFGQPAVFVGGLANEHRGQIEQSNIRDPIDSGSVQFTGGGEGDKLTVDDNWWAVGRGRESTPEASRVVSNGPYVVPSDDDQEGGNLIDREDPNDDNADTQSYSISNARANRNTDAGVAIEALPVQDEMPDDAVESMPDEMAT